MCGRNANRTNYNDEGTNFHSRLDLPGCSTGPNSTGPSTSVRGNSLKRKNNEILKRKSMKTETASALSSSSDSDSPTADSQKNCIRKRKDRTENYRSGKQGKTSLKTSQSCPLNHCDSGTSSESSSQQAQGCEHDTPRQEVPSLTQLPEPTFTRQLEAITGRLDHLMFLQRNALDPSQRGRNGNPQDNSPLRNTGQLFGCTVYSPFSAFFLLFPILNNAYFSICKTIRQYPPKFRLLDLEV